MRLKKFIYASAIAAACFATTGCSNWLDVNHDPNYPATVPMEQLLPGIEVGAGYNGMSWDCLFRCGVYNQYITQAEGASQFRENEKFENEEFSMIYRVYLTTVLGEAKALKAGVDENSNYALIAELISIYSWQNITDFWGDVPYSEALDPQNIEPHFDKSEDIYADLLARINTVIDNINNGFYTGNVSQSYDFIFAGDMNKWKLFANSLKLKIMHRLSNTSSYNNADVLAFVEANSFLDVNAQLSDKLWQNKVSKMYPADEYENGNYFSLNVRASLSIVSYMAEDSRLSKIFTKVGDAYVGKLQGDFVTKGTESQVSLATLVKNIPLISTWEVNFDIAEVYLLSGNNAKAKEYYEKAVAESFKYWGLAGKETDVTEGYGQWSGNNAADFKTLCLQRWAAFLFTQHGEAFHEMNRTGYPEVAAEKDAAKLKDAFPKGNITFPACGTYTGDGRPKSMLIPLDYVQSLNSNTPKRPINNCTPLFWQKK